MGGQKKQTKNKKTVLLEEELLSEGGVSSIEMLTPKQQAFVEEYLIDLNSTQAAIRAGYSEKTAHSQGPRLLDNVEVCALIREAIKKRSEKTQIDAEWVLRRLSEESEADLADLYDKGGNIKPIQDWPLVWRQGLVDGIDVQQIGESNGTITKIKLANRGKRLEMLGRHVDVQAFKDRVEHSADKELAEWLIKK